MDTTLLQKLTGAFKSLSTSDKWLLGAAAGILINPAVALVVAGLILLYFAWKIGKAIVP